MKSTTSRKTHHAISILIRIVGYFIHLTNSSCFAVKVEITRVYNYRIRALSAWYVNGYISGLCIARYNDCALSFLISLLVHSIRLHLLYIIYLRWIYCIEQSSFLSVVMKTIKIILVCVVFLFLFFIPKA